MTRDSRPDLRFTLRQEYQSCTKIEGEGEEANEVPGMVIQNYMSPDR